MERKATHILIVDDEPINIILIKEIVGKYNYQISTASDGISALSAAQANKPDLILLDIRMPGMNGFEVCEKLKLDANLSSIPVIFLSSLIDTSDIVRAFKVGAIDYIIKPPQPEELAVRLHTHLKLHEQTEELRSLNEKLQESQSQLSKFSSHLQNVREIERSSLALEIHDKIAQILVALKIDMGILQKKMNNQQDETINLAFQNTIKLVDSTIKTVRDIVDNLRPEQIDILGFVEAIKLSLYHFQKKTGINSKINSNVSKLDIETQKSLILFQILQEALLNISLHANATEVILNLDVENNTLTMEIVDNGVGFEPDNISDKNSYELLGIKHKVKIFDGDISIRSKINEGTTIRILMKLDSVT